MGPKELYKIRRRAKLFLIPILLGVGLGLNSCNKKNKDVSELPEVNTLDITSITINSAVGGCNIIKQGSSKINAAGICLSTDVYPTISGSVITGQSVLGTTEIDITDLQAKTNYYVRAFATNGSGTAYGDVKQFRTASAWERIDGNLVGPTGPGSIEASGDDVYMYDSGNRVFHSGNNGDTWQLYNNGIGATNALGRLAVSGQSVYLVYNNGRAYASGLHDNSWMQIVPTFTNIAYTYAVTAVIVKDNFIFAGTQTDGVFIASLNGNGWSSVNTGISCLGIRAMAAKNSTLLAATYGGGIFSSSNNGASWSPMNNGLANRNIFAVAVNGNDLYAGTDAGSFLSTNGGAQWNQTDAGLDVAHAYFGFAFRNDVVYSVFDSGILSSISKGSSWKDFSTGLSSGNLAQFPPAISNKYIFSMASDPSDGHFYIFRRSL